MVSSLHSPDVFIFWPVSAHLAFFPNRDNQCNHNISGKTRTFKPRKDVPEGTKQYQLRKYAEATLVSLSSSRSVVNVAPEVQGSGNLRLAVRLPEGEDLNEWLAVHGMWLNLSKCCCLR